MKGPWTFPVNRLSMISGKKVAPNLIVSVSLNGRAGETRPGHHLSGPWRFADARSYGQESCQVWGRRVGTAVAALNSLSLNRLTGGTAAGDGG